MRASSAAIFGLSTRECNEFGALGAMANAVQSRQAAHFADLSPNTVSGADYVVI
jgi:hypothetical protein